MAETEIYVPDERLVWAPATLERETVVDGSTHITVAVRRPRDDEPLAGCAAVAATIALDAGDASSLPLQDARKPRAVEDLVGLDRLHEASVLATLRERYFDRTPYCRTGAGICVAVNPYVWIPELYGPAALNRWRRGSVLVSGESGAGKTETVKIMLRHLAGSAAAVADRVLSSQPLLESFGNAKTVRNDNSSRFGKFTRLQFATAGAAPSSAPRAGDLLEKSRRRPGAGRAGLPLRLRRRRGARADVGAFAYVKRGDLATTSIGASPTRIDTEGGARDARRAGSDAAAVEDAVLAVLPPLAACSALLVRVVRTRDEAVRVPRSAAEATEARDALAKELYVAVFDWLVRAMNAATRAASPDGLRVVGLLDIFGFECFAVNRFEQLCINYCNEKLQQKFTLDLFKAVQEEYDDERVPWDPVAFPDNEKVLALLEGRMGVVDVLNEECLRPRGSEEAFVTKLDALHGDGAKFAKHRYEPRVFTVAHYAGPVTYAADGWLDRNKDALHDDLAVLAAGSSRPSSRACSRRGGGARRRPAKTVLAKFKGNLASLLDEVERTEVRYVRCVKPNGAKAPRRWDAALVACQLRASRARARASRGAGPRAASPRRGASSARRRPRPARGAVARRAVSRRRGRDPVRGAAPRRGRRRRGPRRRGRGAGPARVSARGAPRGSTPRPPRDAEAAAAELRSAMASPERRAAAPQTGDPRVDGALVDESKRMLDYLRAEVSRLDRSRDGLERENHRLRVANDRVQQAHGAAHESFAALNSHIKRLGRTVVALKRDARDLRQANGVFKDELAMKQAIYVAEVAKGLRLEQLMRTMVDVCDVRGADPDLVAELRAMADARALHDGGVRDAEVAAGGEEAAQPGFWGRLIGRGS
ncbi:hypothetical protein JL720_12020 [Aureococcus anophagefferens]|nr:hypothetical protein JL720_12020 [Aureococcus anophagefferens]